MECISIESFLAVILTNIWTYPSVYIALYVHRPVKTIYIEKWRCRRRQQISSSFIMGAAPFAFIYVFLFYTSFVSLLIKLYNLLRCRIPRGGLFLLENYINFDKCYFNIFSIVILFSHTYKHSYTHMSKGVQ